MTISEWVHDELTRLGALAPNWDGYNAPVIDPDIIASARRFVNEMPEGLTVRPRVVPMSPGNLQLEWHQSDKILELEFETPELIHFLQWQPEVGIEEEDVFPAGDVERAASLIRWFMNGTNA